MDFNKFLKNGTDFFIPNLSIDIVIIGYKENKLKCLLLQLNNKWMLPGGYIGSNEKVDAAAKRILKERTGLEHAHLKFLAVFGDENRQFKNEWKEIFKRFNFPWKENYWINKRFVSLSYYSLVNIENTVPKAGIMDEAIAWFDFDELPEIWMDHKCILEQARNKLKEDIKFEQLTYNLLPNTFTMPELHQLHQDILEEKLDRSRFQKKMLSTNIFERLPQKTNNPSPGRNPYLYKVKYSEK